MKNLYLVLIALLISFTLFSQISVKKVTSPQAADGILDESVWDISNEITPNAQTLSEAYAKYISKKWATTHNINPEITNVIHKTIEGETLLYIINFKNAWVMISADKQLQPILGFSFDSSYTEPDQSTSTNSLFEFYNFVKKQNRLNNIDLSDEWKTIEKGNSKKLDNMSEVSPLITSLWNQCWPYNAYVPLDDSPDLPDYCNGHHNTSCGPTAFAQVLNYWQYPTHGIGYHSYYYNDYGTVEADFQSTYYNWSNMPTSLNSDDNESVYTDIATLMLHAGVSVNGSYTSGSSLNEYSAAAVKYFGYSPTCDVLYRDDFTSTEWHRIYKNELDNGRPIMMSGCSEGSAKPWEYGTHYGHYFVCDGYYGDDFFHINWGWSGSGNGYFPLFSFGKYIYQNYSLIGLEPNYKNKKLIVKQTYYTDDNTVALFHFDGNSHNESTLTDNPNEHGTLSYVDNNELGLGQCLYLNNSNQNNQSYLDIADNVNLDMSGDWTIEMWFKPKSIGTSRNQKFTLLSKPGDNNYNQSNYAIQLIPTDDWMSNSLYCYYYPTKAVDRNTAEVYTDKNFIELEKWYHLTYIRNTTNKTLKVLIHNADWELIHYESTPYCNEIASLPLLNNKPLFIGSNNVSNTFFDGYIDELRISNIIRKFDIESTELTLLSPNGGEFWEPNTSHEISWSYQNIKNLKIEYTLDNEDSWQVITQKTPASTEKYTWITPATTSYNCKIKLTDINNVNSYIKSDSVFSIQSYNLELLTPNGEEYLIPGELKTITWSKTPVKNIKIELSDNNGTNWKEITASTLATTGRYDWVIPEIKSNLCKIRITDIANASIFDESDNLFNIGPSNNARGPYNVDDHTVVLLHFEGDLINQSNMSDNGSYNGSGISYSSRAPSILGKCLKHDGSTFITIPHNENLNLDGDWTIEAWVKLNEYRGYPNDPYILRKPGNHDDYWANYALGIVEAWGNVLHGFYYPETNFRRGITGITLPLNQWYHIAYCRDVSNSLVSITVRNENWEIISTKSKAYTRNTVLFSSKDIRIGENFNGYIDELRISNIVRTFEPRLSITDLDSKNNYIIYPNPASSNVYIDVPDKINLKISTIAGKIIIKRNHFKGGSINTSNLSDGMYLVIFESTDGVVIKKLIIK